MTIISHKLKKIITLITTIITTYSKWQVGTINILAYVGHYVQTSKYCDMSLTTNYHIQKERFHMKHETRVNRG